MRGECVGSPLTLSEILLFFCIDPAAERDSDRVIIVEQCVAKFVGDGTDHKTSRC